ncbi:hypothetical protein MSSIH_2390 [Methanosarcina siciliae HI350]|uniref:WbqC-like protein family protein n=1 Tax=Methanosarcina siciliae HI350 TaxID=1434119 RepID=A0A0E3PEN7_9EURY|nr:WbqC family protein [Methanosarcina siciliae]AKB33080.1 hypothetical protein MSSIH_2390 [Methanosarcina siciliae HI350]
MKIGIMQPYFLPYIGYWQLLNAVDKFVVYDNIQFMKAGWINRNRILLNAKDFFITIPLKHDSYSLNIRDRFISDQYFDKGADQLLRAIRDAYRKAPYFKETMPVIEKCFLYEEKNISKFIFNSIQIISEYLEITSEIIFSPYIELDHSIKGQERAIEICRYFSATVYINPIGGLELYDSKSFESNGIELKFIKSKTDEYKQFGNEFIPNLSIVDVMMFNSKDEIKKMINMYELIGN